MNFGVFGTKRTVCIIEVTVRSCLTVHFLFCNVVLKKRMIALLKSNNAKILSTFCCAMENIIA